MICEIAISIEQFVQSQALLAGLDHEPIRASSGEIAGEGSLWKPDKDERSSRLEVPSFESFVVKPWRRSEISSPMCPGSSVYRTN